VLVLTPLREIKTAEQNYQPHKSATTPAKALAAGTAQQKLKKVASAGHITSNRNQKPATKQ
jgi:hypothetical protein